MTNPPLWKAWIALTKAEAADAAAALELDGTAQAVLIAEEPFADGAACRHDYGAHHRVRRREPRAPLGQLEGAVDLAGPDDARDGIDAERLRMLLREIFTAAGGTHDDFDTYDRVMREERRTAVFVHPDRVYASPGQ